MFRKYLLIGLFDLCYNLVGANLILIKLKGFKTYANNIKVDDKPPRKFNLIENGNSLLQTGYGVDYWLPTENRRGRLSFLFY